MMFETYKFLCLGKSTFYTVTYKLCNILKSSFFFQKVIMSYSYSIQIYVHRFYISLKLLSLKFVNILLIVLKLLFQRL